MEKVSIQIKPPFSYYGGKQLMLKYILPNIPKHRTYVEPFVGGGAVFWAKKPSEVEILNDTNGEIMNFYEVLKNDFIELEKYIRISLHSRDLHRKAWVIYTNPDMFDRVKRAWAVWVLANMGYGGLLSESWGRDITQNKTVKKIMNARERFTEEYAIRLQIVELESRDAIKIIETTDYKDAFFYCDPPYFNSDMGHYDGYTIDDFERLLNTLSKIKGKFLLSSYPSDILEKYKKIYNWHQIEIKQRVSMSSKGKRKIEVLTANYPLVMPK